MVYNHHTVKHFIHGSGSIKQAADVVKNLGGKKAFIVTDPGLANVGVQKPLEEALTAGGVEWELFAKAELEPSMDSIQACTDAAKAAGVLIGKTTRSFRGFNNTLTLCPALISTKSDIEELVAGIDTALTTVEQKFGL